jgi:pyruvate dehydrogenase (quinone)
VAITPSASIVRPGDDELDAAAELLNGANSVTILAGAGCQGAHDEVVALAELLQAPVVHALRGKEFVEYDNPYDVGMTGLQDEPARGMSTSAIDALRVGCSALPDRRRRR